MENMRAEMVVMSHLSDVQEEISFGYASDGINYKINFIKFIIFECDGDLNKEINPDELWKRFNERFGQ